VYACVCGAQDTHRALVVGHELAPEAEGGPGEDALAALVALPWWGLAARGRKRQVLAMGIHRPGGGGAVC
jgi:hypothetical protein